MVGTPWRYLPVPSGMTPESAAWSPDGKEFAYLSGRDHRHGAGDATLTIRTLNTGKGNRVHRAVRDAVHYRRWTNDGRGESTRWCGTSRERDHPLEVHLISRGITVPDTMVTSIPGAQSSPLYGPLHLNGNALLIAFGNSLLPPGGSAGLIAARFAYWSTRSHPDGRGIANRLFLPMRSQVAALGSSGERLEDSF